MACTMLYFAFKVTYVLAFGFSVDIATSYNKFMACFAQIVMSLELLIYVLLNSPPLVVSQTVCWVMSLLVLIRTVVARDRHDLDLNPDHP